MQRVIPFMVAPVLAASTLGIAYITYRVESVSRTMEGNHPETLSSPPTPATAEAPQPTPVPSITATPVITPTPKPLSLGSPLFNLFTVNPQFKTQQVSFTLSQPADVEVQIASEEHQAVPVRVFSLGLQPVGTVHMEWDGRDDANNPVPAGNYTYTITATDDMGVRRTQTKSGLGITYKRIVISLSEQRLTAYNNNSTKFLSTLVTTGNSALPTPVGVFSILSKESPFTFTSSRPPGSKYYYPPSPVSYALLFDNGGYFIHDAPWRHIYGPGTNTKLGKPGSNYTGSHGCVNVPLAAAKKLYEWATIGTIVQVVR